MNFSPEQIIRFLSTLFVFIFCIPVHEYAHGRVAYALGDDTAKKAGRLTLNPLASVDLLGLLSLIFLRFGWAKPVPINSSNFKNPRMGRVLTSIAGPLSNFIMGFLSFILSVVFTIYGRKGILGFFFMQVGITNLSLAIFNMLPILPFDGGQIVSALLPERTYYKIVAFMQRYRGVITVVLLVLLSLGLLSGPLSKALLFVAGKLYRLAFSLVTLFIR